MMNALRWMCGVLFTLFATAAAATFHTFDITQLYSNADGSIQFIVLTEQEGAAAQNLFAGHAVTSTQGAVQHTFTFAQNLPSSNTGNRSVLIATPGLAALGVIVPDYTMPAGFLFTNGGTVDFAGVDDLTYAALPTDGVTALFKGGATGPNLAKNFAGATASITAPSGQATVNVVEYHHATFDHYFITPVPGEIALLDAHAPPFEQWSRTGFSFNVYPNAGAPAGSVATCRFFNDHFFPKSSHFYAAHGFGCEATIALFPDWFLEDDKLFNTMLPDATTGDCPAGTIPVYRMYNQGMGAAPNHRFVTSLAERQKMIGQGWVAEGAGAIGVGMCVPS